MKKAAGNANETVKKSFPAACRDLGPSHSAKGLFAQEARIQPINHGLHE